MSTNNPSPHFKGTEQKMTREVEGKFWGVQTKIKELERKFKAADGKTQVHYHEWLEKLNWDLEALQVEITRREGRGDTEHP